MKLQIGVNLWDIFARILKMKFQIEMKMKLQI